MKPLQGRCSGLGFFAYRIASKKLSRDEKMISILLSLYAF